MSILDAGIHAIAADVYHADPCAEPSLSASLAKVLLAQSPLHAWMCHPRLNRDAKPVEKTSFDIGSAAHALLLEGGANVAVIDPAAYPAKNGNIPDGWTNDAIRGARDDARSAGRIPVLKRDFGAMEQMRDAAMMAIDRCADLSGLRLDQGDAECSLIWQDSGIWCRARLDWLSHDRETILDYKTTTDATPKVFARQLPRMGYHIQEAFYRRGLRALTRGNPHFVFLAQEIEPPFGCSFHAVDPSLAEIADAQVERAIRTWAQCLARDSWPGYGNRIHWCVAENWQMQEHEEMLAEGIPFDVAQMWTKNERATA